ncbi:MAG: inosine/xanthosine triphosphatase [Candidatus Wenzhouxiangella sp. M2_3B_020]
MKRLVVASSNPVKLRAVRGGFEAMFPDEEIDLLPVSVDSGVSDQPSGSDETLAGARNRARAASLSRPDADYWFGIEGGIEDRDSGMAAFAWVVARCGETEGRGRTAEFVLPEAVAELVRDGLELGEADDRVFGRSDSKRKEGAIGLLTGNAIDRASLYREAVVMALIPFRNASLYRGSR